MVGCWVGVRLAHFYLLCNNVHSYLSICVCMHACMYGQTYGISLLH